MNSSSIRLGTNTHWIEADEDRIYLGCVAKNSWFYFNEYGVAFDPIERCNRRWNALTDNEYFQELEAIID